MRIGGISPGSSRGAPYDQRAPWSRRLVSVLALAASLAALALIVEGHHAQARFSESLPRPLDAIAQATVVREQAAAVAPAEEGRFRALSEYLARRYRVSQDVAFDLVVQAHRAGRAFQLDPLLIIAVIAIESSFNPIAESVAGAKGLMQIIPKYHPEKLEAFGDERAVFDPAINIQVGAQILKEYIRNTGNLGIALQMYNGALNDSEDRYTNKVLGMKQRLQYVVTQAPSGSAAVTAPGAIRTASARNTDSFSVRFD